MTERSAQIIKTVDMEMFKDIKTLDGEYQTTWYEITAAIVNGTAAPVPSAGDLLCRYGR